MKDADRFTLGRLGRDARPWTRWWWLGSCVTEEEITRQLGLLRDAGFGGVEIQPIYAPEDPPVAPLRYLSPPWTRILAHALREAERLGLGVDLTMGSGWPWGGPWVAPQHAARRLVVKRAGGAATARSIGTGQEVKRASTGGEGPVADPYSRDAVREFLGGFEQPLASLGPVRPRAAFTDSFEVFGADHTPGLADAFRARRGYQLEPWLARLDDDDATGRRLRHDYRWTMAELLEDSYREWTAWCHANGMAARLQAHGSPGPLVDYYTLADIPETEAFNRTGLVAAVSRMAASAAHLAGRPVCSAEAFTWLGEHFTVSLDDLRRAADGFYLAGVNRIFFHGVAFSPADLPWPGWLFYAATNSGEGAGWFAHLGLLNACFARVQAAMDRGAWDPDVLVYFPQHDVYAADGTEFDRAHSGRLRLCTVSNAADWFARDAAGTWRAVAALDAAGVQYDFATDRIVRDRLSVERGRIRVDGEAGPSYAALIVAGCRLVERGTLDAMARLAADGADVWMVGGAPRAVPTGPDPGAGFDGGEVSVGGRMIRAEADLAAAIDGAGVRRERLEGFDFIRRRDGDTSVYFLRRDAAEGVDAWLAFRAAGGTARVTDPVTGRVQPAVARADAAGGTEVRLAVEPGGTRIVEIGTGFGSPVAKVRPTGAARVVAVAGPWRLSWTDAAGVAHVVDVDRLAPWPDIPGIGLEPAAVEYATQIDLAAEPGEEDWLLDLGDLAGSAAASVDGIPIGTAWTAPYRLAVPRGVLARHATLRLRVLVVEANRIIDLDRRKVPWRKFFFVNRDYETFDASSWTPLPVGLLGPVTLSSR